MGKLTKKIVQKKERKEKMARKKERSKTKSRKKNPLKKFANTKLCLPNPACKMAFERIFYSTGSSRGFRFHELPSDTSDQMTRTKHLAIWRLPGDGFVIGRFPGK